VAETAGAGEHTAQVWWANRQDAAPALAGLLDEIEQRRWTAYRRDEDRERFLVGCALAKAAVASYVGRPARDIALDRTCSQCAKPHGKPVVTGSAIELSLSHSGDRIAVAVARQTPLGVDVEQVRKRGGDDPDALARHVLAEQELAAVRTPEDFLVAWTRKEAVTKATGDGLRVSFREVILSPPGEPPRLIAWPYPASPETVSLFDLDVGPGYKAALAVIGRCDGVLISDGSALLKTITD
jgi:4'-phosphopantetheinyl transferase